MSAIVNELKNISADTSVIELVLNVTDEKANDDTIEKTVEEFGCLDYAVNCAGLGGLNIQRRFRDSHGREQ
jgi:NADP-dependent 3-hydroxy acid dehydrogenase YdfG